MLLCRLLLVVLLAVRVSKILLIDFVQLKPLKRGAKIALRAYLANEADFFSWCLGSCWFFYLYEDHCGCSMGEEKDTTHVPVTSWVTVSI